MADEINRLSINHREVKEMSGNKKPFHVLPGLFMSLIVMMAVSMTARAGEEKESNVPHGFAECRRSGTA